MIAQLSGEIVHKEPTCVVINVGGVGYELHISLYTYEQLKALDSCTIFSVLQGKNEGNTLYGFYTQEEKAWWLRLITVNNIGPRTALTILSSLTPQELHGAILDKNEKLLSSIKGIGRKAAQRIILELETKAKQLAIGNVDHTQGTPLTSTIYHDALTALTTLGIPKKVAEKAIDSVQSTAKGPLTLEELIKKALHP